MFKRAQAAGLCLPCEPDRCVVPVSHLDGSVDMEPWPYIRPSELLKALLDSGYRNLLLPTAKDVRRFWRLWLQDHPDDEFHDAIWAPYIHRVIPLQLWGDEGTLRESSWMLLSMMSVLCPERVRTLSQASRYLLFSFPVDEYHKENGVNLSLQSLIEQVVVDLNRLFEEGIQTSSGLFFARVIGLKGDMKWMGQSLNLVRTSSHNLICPFCLASKTDPGMLFTNVREDAPWRGTVFSSNPWTTLPKLMLLKGFTLHSLKFDLMHLFHLGTGRDVAATTIKELIKARIFQGNNRKERFAAAYRSLKTWANLHGKTLALRKFSKENLYWYSDTCPVPCLQFWSFCRSGVSGL